MLHCCYMFLTATDFGNMLSDFEKLCLMFSALVHDINHTGRTNQFEVNSFSKYAI